MSDAWIFLAVGMASRPSGTASIRGPVASADALNHGIPTKDEVETSVSRLIAAGLVDAYGEELWLTDAGVAEFDAAMTGVPMIQAMLDLGRRWAATGFPPPSPRAWSVPHGSM